MNKLSKSLYRDKDGNKIDIEQLEYLLRDDDYRIVLAERVGPYYISTVWLGVPHGVSEPFDYYETMVFLTPEGAECPRSYLGKALHCERYHFIGDAILGHDEIVEEWAKKFRIGKDEND